MKKLTLISVLCASSLFGGTSALAATELNGFTVDVTLTSKCLATTTTAPSLAFAYESFQIGASTPAQPISLTFKCTRGIAEPTLSFDTVNGTAIGEGVVGGLRYTLSVGANSTSATGGSGATPTSLGTDKILTYSVTGSIQPLQAGDALAARSNIRSLIITY